MQRRSLNLLAHGLVLIVLICLSLTAAAGPYGISGPFVHKNLAVYMILGPSRDGPVPLTLQEALAQSAVKLHETGNVYQLKIENLGDREVFLQAGDLVKGGKQDRVLSVSLLLPPRSGPMAVSAFCVEQRRWAARDAESAARFSSADFALPSRRAKLAINATHLSAGAPSTNLFASNSQRELWRIVASMQRDLSKSLSAPVASARSPSSLQLALENGTLDAAAAPYVDALKPAGTGNAEIIGFAFAINGKLNSAEVYPSHGLFTKLWPKLLKASTTEAIAAQKEEQKAALPTGQAVLDFLKQAEEGNKAVKSLAWRHRLESREADRMVFFQTTHAAGHWVHRSYIAK